MLVTLTQMKDYLGIKTGTTTHDSFLTMQLGLVSDAVEAYCRRVFTTSNWVQTFYAEDYPPYAKTLELFHYPVSAVASVVQDTTTLTTEEYRINKPSGILSKNPLYASWWDSYRSFMTPLSTTVVTYTAGYDTIPSPVLACVYAIIEERYNKKSSGVNLNFGSDVQRIAIPGSISVDFDYTLNNNDRKNPFGLILGAHLNVLDNYRSERAVVGSGRLMYVEPGEEDP